MTEITPLVSVCLITFNQEKFLSKAIEGILNQIVDFEVELIISDDCSEDNTENIVKFYQSNHPNGYWIKYFRHPHNLGMINNFKWTLNKCSGKYIALCEGDDYWIDNNKLTTQTDFLNLNNEFVLVFHPVYELMPNGEYLNNYKINYKKHKQIYNLIDLLMIGNFIHTPSVLFRNLQISFPSQFEKSPIGDYFLYVLLAQEGLFYRQEKLMSVYRVGSGIYSSLSYSKQRLKVLKMYSIFYELFDDFTIRKIIKVRILELNFGFIRNFLISDISYDFDKISFLKSSFTITEIIKSTFLKLFK